MPGRYISKSALANCKINLSKSVLVTRNSKLSCLNLETRFHERDRSWDVNTGSWEEIFVTRFSLFRCLLRNLILRNVSDLGGRIRICRSGATIDLHLTVQVRIQDFGQGGPVEFGPQGGGLITKFAQNRGFSKQCAWPFSLGVFPFLLLIQTSFYFVSQHNLLHKFGFSVHFTFLRTVSLDNTLVTFQRCKLTLTSR